MKLANTYTLDSVVNGVAKVKVVSKITSPEGATIQGMTVTMDGDMKGVNGFDLATGIPVSGDLTMDLKMKISTQGQEIPMAMKMDMLIEGKKM
jgi:hypothetical protein